MTVRPFRFAAAIPKPDRGDHFLEVVRRAESQGYTDFAIFDHFSPNFAPIAGLTAAAMVAPSMRVSCTVFDNDFRHPAVLAKEMATLDQLTGGRVDVGIGAGWLKSDYDQTGILYDRPGIRIDRMEEAIAIMRGLWTDGPVDFQGEHYTISGMEGHPKPAQHPLPIFIGGGGRRMLNIAAREADIIGVHVRLGPTGGEEVTTDPRARLAEKIQWIRDDAEDRFGEIELAIQLFAVSIVDSGAEQQAEAERIAAASGIMQLTPELVLESPYHLVGSENEIVEGLQDLRETFGITHFTVFRDLDGFAPILDRLSGA